MEYYEIVLASVVIFAAYLSRTTLGFADGLIAMPLLAVLMPLTVAVPLVALIGTLAACVLLLVERTKLQLRAAVGLIAAGLVGTPIGVWFLDGVDARVVKSVLGMMVVTFSAWCLWKPEAFSLKTNRMSPAFGFMAGVLGGAYNCPGPPLVVFGTLRQWAPDEFRPTLQGYFLVGGTAACLLHLAKGNMSHDVMILFAINVPIMAGAIVTGRWIVRRIDRDRFVRYVQFTLLLIGGMLLWNAATEFVRHE
ncbi:MAG: sulfite exporter TauE/SafE family protein [Planctomycetota bacterium]|nr:sulfite exporter TauE/SafE family protein [Planctomycetota bacterium]